MRNRWRKRRTICHKWNEENELIVERLGAALKKLKKTSQTLEQWHAYQTILTAIAPDTSDSAGCDARAYQAMLKKRFKIYKNVADSAADRRLAIDVDDPSAVWCLAKKKAYRNKLSLKHPDAFLKGAAVWDSETQASANECDVIVDHDMHRLACEWCGDAQAQVAVRIRCTRTLSDMLWLVAARMHQWCA